MSDAEHELRNRVDAFVNELNDLVRRAALEAVGEAFKKGGETGAPATPARKPGRPPKAAAPIVVEKRPVGRPRGRPPGPAATPKATPAAAAAAAAAKRRAGEKRTPEQLTLITEQVHSYIRSNAGQGVEQMAKVLGTSTKELTLPIRKLLAEKKIGSKGQKRATRYFPR